MKNLILLFNVFVVLINTACNSSSPTSTYKQKYNDTISKNTILDTIHPKQVLPHKTDAAKFVEDWAKAINAHDAIALGKMYGPKVYFYNRKVKGDQLGGFWKLYFKDNPDYNIILGNKKEKYNNKDSSTLILFKGTINNKTVYGYQILTKCIDGKNRIILETYEGAKGKSQIIVCPGPEPQSIQSCQDAIDAILRSAPSFSILFDQPNARRVTEFCPGDTGGPENRYQFAVYGFKQGKSIEEKLGTFQLDVKTGELFELKGSENKPNSIPYDLQYKKYLQKYCK